MVLFTFLPYTRAVRAAICIRSIPCMLILNLFSSNPSLLVTSRLKLCFQLLSKIISQSIIIPILFPQLIFFYSLFLILIPVYARNHQISIQFNFQVTRFESQVWWSQSTRHIVPRRAAAALTTKHTIQTSIHYDLNIIQHSRPTFYFKFFKLVFVFQGDRNVSFMGLHPLEYACRVFNHVVFQHLVLHIYIHMLATGVTIHPEASMVDPSYECCC